MQHTANRRRYSVCTSQWQSEWQTLGSVVTCRRHTTYDSPRAIFQKARGDETAPRLRAKTSPLFLYIFHLCTIRKLTLANCTKASTSILPVLNFFVPNNGSLRGIAPQDCPSRQLPVRRVPRVANTNYFKNVFLITHPRTMTKATMIAIPEPERMIPVGSTVPF